MYVNDKKSCVLELKKISGTRICTQNFKPEMVKEGPQIRE